MRKIQFYLCLIAVTQMLGLLFAEWFYFKEYVLKVDPMSVCINYFGAVGGEWQRGTIWCKMSTSEFYFPKWFLDKRKLEGVPPTEPTPPTPVGPSG